MNKYFFSLIALGLMLAPLSLQAKTVSCGPGCVTNEPEGGLQPTKVFMDMTEYNFAAADSCLDSTLIRLGDPKACEDAMAPCKQAFKSCVEAFEKCNTNYTDYYGDHFLNCTQDVMDSCAAQVQDSHGAQVNQACMQKPQAWPTPENENIVFIPGLKFQPQEEAQPEQEGWPQAEAVCGNGIKEGQELCDDGNTDDRDGCTSTCQVEFHYDAPTEDFEKADKPTDGGVRLDDKDSVTGDDGALDPTVGNTLAIASGSGCSLQTINTVGGSLNYLALLFGLTPLAWSVWRRRS